MTRRICRHCGMEYEYVEAGNFMTFCPYCHQEDILTCEYGYGPVVPCEFYVGKEYIGIVRYDKEDQREYRLTSQKYGLDILLKNHYLEALEEAGAILAQYLS